MATALDSFYPFNGQALTNANWQNYLLMFSVDGVRQTLNSTSALAVVQRGAGADKSVDVSAGRLLLQGVFGENSTTKNLTIADNASGNPRIDRVVVRITQATPTMELDILQGTPAGVPVAPTLTQTAATYEVSLAQVAVANGFASILTANITNERAWGSAIAIRAPSTGSATALPYPSYTSSAPVVVLPVTGTTNITSIPIGPANSILILEFSSNDCNVSSANNLKLRHVYVSAVDGSLALYSDGTNWHEIGRGKERVTAHTFLGNPSGATTSPAYGSITAGDLPAHTTWAPAAINQPAALTFTTQVARTIQLGKLAVVTGMFTFTSAGTITNNLNLQLPAGLTMASGAQAGVGSFFYNDISAAYYTGTVFVNSVTVLLFVCHNNTGFLGTTPNIAVAIGDILSFTISVELA